MESDHKIIPPALASRPVIPREKSMRRKLLINDTIGQQFRYFRDEFVAAALAAGITIPLDIIEDTSGKIFNFVKQGGPEFVFNILLIESNSTNFLRISLTLLITTFTILKASLPRNDKHRESMTNIQRMKSRMNTVNLTAEEALHEWILDCIKRVTDEGAVTACTSIIVHTSIPDIQGLAVCLLLHLCSISKEAAAQILQPPNSQLEYKHGEDFFSPRQKFRPEKVQKTNMITHKIHEAKPSNSCEPSISCMSYLLTVCATFRNRINVMRNCADIIIAVANAYPDDYFAYQIAKTPSCMLPALTDPEHHHSELKAPVGFAKDLKNHNARSYASVLDSQQQPSLIFAGIVAPNSHSKQKSNAVPWFGVKLLLKFLHRVETFKLDESSHQKFHEEGVPFASEAEDQSIARCTKQVLIALCTLIVKSSKVAAQIENLQGASELIKLRAAAAALTSTRHPIIEECVSFLQAPKGGSDLNSSHHTTHQAKLPPNTTGASHVQLCPLEEEPTTSLPAIVKHNANEAVVQLQRKLPLRSQTEEVFDSVGINILAVEEGEDEAQIAEIIFTDQDGLNQAPHAKESKSVEWLLKHSLQVPSMPKIITGTIKTKEHVAPQKSKKQVTSFFDAMAEKANKASYKGRGR